MIYVIGRMWCGSGSFKEALTKFMNYIIYGVGKVFDLYRDNFKALGEWEKNMGGVVYLCDRRFDEILTNEYMDFPLISLDKIKEMTDLVVFIS